MRGKVDSMYEVGFQSRITPAYAGKSLAGLHDTPHVWDHPRLCGEKDLLVVQPCTADGITPAYAGKSDR